MSNVFDKILNTLKIYKFNGELRLKDGTFIILDGEFTTGVSISCNTSEGLKSLPDGNYTLEDLRIIFVQNGKIKEIIEPLYSEPTPNPLETPPWVSDGGVGIVTGYPGIGGGSSNGQSMKKEEIENMENEKKEVEVFSDASVDNTKEGPGGTAVNPEPTQETVATDKTQEPLSIEELSSIVKELQGTVATLTDRISALEGTNEQVSQDVQQTTEATKQMKKELTEYFDKNTPVKEIQKLDMDDGINDVVETETSLRIKQLNNLRKLKK